MEILRSVPELANVRGPVFLAIGVFDGVHLGHQAVISTCEQHAADARGTPVVVTFDPHPAKVLRPGRAPHLLTATQHKIALIRDLGVEHLLVIHFDKRFAQTAPEEFVRQLVEHSKPLREICVGHEWSFGKDRAGNLALLKRLGAQYAFEVIGIPAVTVNGQPVSSTAVREAVKAGDFARAAEMLGREFTILGTVKAGAKVGRQLGFATANLSAHNEQFPPDGVYVAEARVHGERHFGVANLGYRPTLDSARPERLLELHLFDFERDIYGRDVEVRFVKYLRPEQKFANLDALRAQIAADVKRARELLSRPAGTSPARSF